MRVCASDLRDSLIQSFTQPLFIPNLYDVRFSAEHVIYFEECCNCYFPYN